MGDLQVHGISVPSFFYGTAWKEDATSRLTTSALEAGFRAIDTANQRKHYFEAGVGQAVADFVTAGHCTRQQLFLQTKFTYRRGQDHRLPYDEAAPLGEQVQQSFASSLEHLQTDYIDSYVLHGPQAGRGLTDGDWEVWAAMEALHDGGQAKLLGVSNIALEQLQALHAGAQVKPAFVQNRCYARLGWDKPVREFCLANDIAYQGFSLLTANLRELNHPVIHRLMKDTNMSMPQIVFRFAMQIGMLPLTGTTDPQHMAQDLACTKKTLDDDDVAAIESLAI